MQFRILILAVVFVFCQSCLKASFTEKKLEPEKPLAPAAPVVNPIEAQQEIYEMKEGDNIAARLKKINVYDLKNKKKNLHTLLAGKDSLLIMVKPGCIFCESMLAVMNTVKPIVRPSLFIALEGSHTTQEQFKEKYKKNSALKATWIYDQDGKLNSELGLVSFPRLVYINKNLEVVRNQVGLVVPANKEKLENEPFPVILQKLSEETIAWMQSL
jgi:thioredoxin-related protein